MGKGGKEDSTKEKEDKGEGMSKSNIEREITSCESLYRTAQEQRLDSKIFKIIVISNSNNDDR